MKAIERISRGDAIKILSTTPEAKAFSGDWNQYIYSTTELWAGISNGELVVIWGLMPPSLISNHAYLWSYTFPALANHTFTFVRGSQLVIQELLKRYSVINGHTEGRKSKKWLKWLGAEFGEPTLFGTPFEIRANNG